MVHRIENVLFAPPQVISPSMILQEYIFSTDWDKSTLLVFLHDYLSLGWKDVVAVAPIDFCIKQCKIAYRILQVIYTIFPHFTNNPFPFLIKTFILKFFVLFYFILL